MSETKKCKNKYPRRCCVVNCGNDNVRNWELTFFRFPKDLMRCKQWIVASGRIDLIGKDMEYLCQNPLMCSWHFEDFMFCSSLKTRLKDCAVPTIFRNLPLNAPDMASIVVGETDFKTVKYRVGHKEIKMLNAPGVVSDAVVVIETDYETVQYPVEYKTKKGSESFYLEENEYLPIIPEVVYHNDNSNQELSVSSKVVYDHDEDDDDDDDDIDYDSLPI